MSGPSILKPVETTSEAEGLSEETFYQTLTTRNRHFVSEKAQANLRQLRVFVAGCGSGGGACIEPLTRLGVSRLRIADNGSYELANLNRQHAFVDSIGVNKATFHVGEVRRINPHADIVGFPEGITESNLGELVRWADLVLDCVDVTTSEAIELKVSLHERSHRWKRPVFSMLDLGFCQWGRSYDYRQPRSRVLDGHLAGARSARHPIKVMFEMFPLTAVPPHSMPLMLDLLRDVTTPASQLGCASDLLSAVIAAAAIRFAETGDIVEGWNINLENLAMPLGRRLYHWLRYPSYYLEARRLLRQIV